jgi:hypothetical protein
MPSTRANVTATVGGNSFFAGKNAIINGDFNINQRGFSSTTGDGFGLDRWKQVQADGTSTYSVQTFTLGTAPVVGYEAKNFARVAISGQTLSGAATILIQPIESVRTFANQTVTISFWAKANSGTPAIAIELQQYFGTGGSPSATVNTYAGKATISTSWARYSITATVPSISGKTIGSNNNDALNLNIWLSSGSNTAARTGSIGIQNNTFDIWGVQVEQGSVPTAFQTATGTIQGELAACQRYYFRNTGGSAYSRIAATISTGSTTAIAAVYFPVQMRVKPTSVEYANLQVNEPGNASLSVTALTIDTDAVGPMVGGINITTNAGLIGTKPGYLRNENNTAGYLGFSAEL